MVLQWAGRGLPPGLRDGVSKRLRKAPVTQKPDSLCSSQVVHILRTWLWEACGRKRVFSYRNTGKREPYIREQVSIWTRQRKSSIRAEEDAPEPRQFFGYRHWSLIGWTKAGSDQSQEKPLMGLGLGPVTGTVMLKLTRKNSQKSLGWLPISS